MLIGSVLNHKDELEDRSLQYLDPIGYKEIEDDLLMTEEGRDKFIESIKNQILAKPRVQYPVCISAVE